MLDWLANAPTWYIIRYLGIISYMLLTAGLCLGIVYGFPHWNGKTKASLYKLHTWLTNGGTAIGLLHGVAPVIDTYMPFDWSGVLIPFTAAHRPVLTGLGTLAGYGLLILIFTSDIKTRLGKKLWLAIHLSAYPVFAMAFIHGFFLGTDSASPGIRIMYVTSIAAVLALTAARGLARRKPRQELISAGGKSR
ncbi:ferric reductase-like transmembrane domain-containing protein [Paenibacillus chartarius]|uniref:Ferric reductase-like transmembrane domain-containing protein n=1 Tax=Paenibacillus chartarius TaxID=747481 RepID=A0ABV6DR55_9BACL